LTSNDRAHLVCETSLGALVVVDDQRRHLRVNEPATRLLSAPVEEIVGQPIDRFTPPEQRPRLEAMWQQLRSDGELEGEYEVLQANGARVWTRFRARWGFGTGEHLIAGLAVEIPPSAPPPRGLTPRELEILQLAAGGHSTKAISEALVVSPATVKTHFENIYEKLAMPNRVSAVAEALRRGLIQ
jgi:PAS domain S-box-containing protein